MREITYTLPTGPIKNTYREGERLAMLRMASLPDACVACGAPARGNVFHKEFKSWPWLWMVLPIGFDVIALVGQFIFGKKYAFDFPFCPNCSPDHFQLTEIFIERRLAVFTGASAGFSNLLPAAPPDLAAEMNRDWLERKFSNFYR